MEGLQWRESGGSTVDDIAHVHLRLVRIDDIVVHIGGSSNSMARRDGQHEVIVQDWTATNRRTGHVQHNLAGS